MRSFLLAAAGALVLVSTPAFAADTATATPASIAPAPVSTPMAAHLIEVAGLGAVFEKFGQSLAASARAGGLDDEPFLAAWEDAALEAFGRSELTGQLVSGFAALDAGEAASIETFLGSPAGLRIRGLEAETQAIAPEYQLDAIARGQATYFTASHGRRAQIDELMTLSNAEFTFALLAESLRGMAVSLHLHGNGDIDVPWEEIDNGVAMQLAGMHESLAEASRGVMALTYAPLSDDELEAYLAFMRAPATRKFYGIATLVIGTAIRDTMATLGPAVAARLGAVAI